MKRAYLDAALHQAERVWLDESDEWFFFVPALPGVWGLGRSDDPAASDLPAAIEGWVALGRQLGHDLPGLDGILPD